MIRKQIQLNLLPDHIYLKRNNLNQEKNNLNMKQIQLNPELIHLIEDSPPLGLLENNLDLLVIDLNL